MCSRIRSYHLLRRKHLKSKQIKTNSKVSHLKSKNGFKFEAKDLALDAQSEGEEGRGQEQAEVELLPLLLEPLRRRPRHRRCSSCTHDGHLRAIDLLDSQVMKTNSSGSSLNDVTLIL